MNKILIVIFLTLTALSAYALELDNNIRTFAANMESCYGVSQDEVTMWLLGAKMDETALKRMDAQTEAKPWSYYKPLFVTNGKSLKGLEFYMDHEDALKRAEAEYGVDRYIIAAILGVETDFGKFALQHRALDTLATLAFYYPRRAAFFQNELKWLFIIADEEGIDAAEYTSSYAGAVGMPQFMPSNIKKFGVDFDHDGKVNIVQSADDAIGSIANYLKAHGFKLGAPTAVKADVSGDTWADFANKGLKPRYALSELIQNGITPQTPIDNIDIKTAYYYFPVSETENENWLMFNNFYAITRYNPSVRYALAVTLLAEEIKTNVQYAIDSAILAN